MPLSSTREVRGRIVRWETCPSVLVGGLYAAYFVSNFPGAASRVLAALRSSHLGALGDREPSCVHAMAHVSCRLSLGRGETPAGVSPSPSPPWGSTWAASCGHATQVPLSSVPQAQA